MIGQCKLCLKTGVELRDSHFLSAGIYRILRDDNEKNPNPWLLTKDAVVQTSSQLKAHLLCHDCEQRFSKNGGTWVLGRCRRNEGRFPLADVLAARTPDIASAGNTTRIYNFTHGSFSVNDLSLYRITRLRLLVQHEDLKKKSHPRFHPLSQWHWRSLEGW